MKQRVFILCGLPGSGKSTWAKTMVKNNSNIAVVNKDAIRFMLGGGNYVFNDSLEMAVKYIAIHCLVQMIVFGYNVIIDETNLTRAKRKSWINHIINTEIDCNIDIVWFRETEKNLDNRMQDPRGYSREKWEEVISNMKKIFEPPDDREGVPIKII